MCWAVTRAFSSGCLAVSLMLLVVAGCEHSAGVVAGQCYQTLMPHLAVQYCNFNMIFTTVFNFNDHSVDVSE